MIHRPFFVLLFAGILMTVSIPVSAQNIQAPVSSDNGPLNETPVAFGLQGIWSSPDCTAAREVFIIAPHYTLFYRPGYYRLGAVQTWRQEEDDSEMLYQFRTNRMASLIKRTNDGLMKIRMIDVNPAAPLKSAWGSIEDDTAREFAHCAKLFDSGTDFGQDEVNAVFQLDTAFKGCRDIKQGGFKTATACHQALFNLADSNKDKLLDHTELGRIYRQAFFALSASAYCGGLGYPENSRAEAEDFAAAILGPDKSISYAQLLARLATPGFIKGRIFTFVENVGNSQALLPFVPAPDTLKTCSMVEPENQKRLGTIALPDEGQNDKALTAHPEPDSQNSPDVHAPDAKSDGPAPLPAQTRP